MNSSVEVKTPHIPSELVGADQITQIVLEHIKTQEKQVVDVDELIVNYGFVSSLGPIKNGV